MITSVTLAQRCRKAAAAFRASDMATSPRRLGGCPETVVVHVPEDREGVPEWRPVAVPPPPSNGVPRLRAYRPRHSVAEVIRAAMGLPVQRTEAQGGDESVRAVLAPGQALSQELDLRVGCGVEAQAEELGQLSGVVDRLEAGTLLLQPREAFQDRDAGRWIALGTRYADSHGMDVATGGGPFANEALEYCCAPSTKWIEDYTVELRCREMLLNEGLGEHREVRTKGVEAMSHTAFVRSRYEPIQPRPFFVLTLVASWAAGAMVWSARHVSGRQDALRAGLLNGRGRVLVWRGTQRSRFGRTGAIAGTAERRFGGGNQGVAGSRRWRTACSGHRA